MRTTLAKEIIECLPKQRTLFYYHTDAYALQLLRYTVGDGLSIQTLRKTSFAHLLQKPLIKKRLAYSGNGLLSNDHLWFDYQQVFYPFVVTLSTWGYERNYDWQQTSRPGTNIVLQLNFPNHHEQAYRRLIQPKRENLFNFFMHPVKKKQKGFFFRHTLAWARIDISYETNEALIEEIQSDWCNEMNEIKKELRTSADFNNDYLGMTGDKENIAHYIDDIMAPYMKLWSEAMLSATIAFIYEELGITNIYYHSYETGHRIKKIGHFKAPRSLYTQLPKKFGFNQTQTTPSFIRMDKISRRKIKKIKNLNWFVMNLGNDKKMTNRFNHLQTM